MLRRAKAIVSSSEAFDHSKVRDEGKIACERSGGYADAVPWEKMSLSKGSRTKARATFSSRA
jgi:hypothetical protein